MANNAEHHHPHHAHKEHSHSGHHHGPVNYNRAFLIGFILNVIIVAVQIIFGLLSNSLALLADAGHNLGDVIGLVIAWGASWLVLRRPTARYTYGLRRSSILAALLNACLIMIALGAIALEAIHRLQNPPELKEGVVIIVAAIGMICNGFTAWLFAKDHQTDLNIKGVFLHMLTDALVSLGVVLGAVGIMVTRWYWLDPVMSLIITILIFVGTWNLLKDSVSLLLDAVPNDIEFHAVQTYLQELPNVQDLHDLHIWAMSTTEIALTAHLVIPHHELDDTFLLKINQDLQKNFGIKHTTIQLETGNPALTCEHHQCYRSYAPQKTVS
ncbi:MAG: cation diffusion facilitator family transporter [Snowella sp.]|nr:cation diffusion facilitator family transporter [Snowella sp.]